MYQLNLISHHPNDSYQKHIDGIRAIAVLAVILFHANAVWLPGGFVGVDIFFVISGYLISGLIFKQVLSGQYTFSEFFVRRIRRIFPALLVVITFSFLFAWVVLLPDEMRNFSKSIYSTVLMFSNKQFLAEAGYFDTQSHLKPLLHTWSLSIEGQFYLFFPLAFVAVIKLTKRPIYFIALLMFISFFYAEKISHFESEKSFFYFFARAWELLAGCIVMLMLNQVSKRNNYVDQIFSIVGLSCIFYAFLFFERSMLHPGVITLIPIIGVALLIAFSTEKTWIGRLLTTKLMVGIGLISYSLYLWHQPIICFTKIQFAQLGWAAWLFIFGLITLFSILTWKYIETPFRSRQFISTKRVVYLITVYGLILCLLGIWGYQNNGFIHQRYTKEKISIINALDGDVYKTFLFKNLYGNEIPEHKYLNNDEPRVLVVGDSYAADFMNMVVSNRYFKNHQVRTLYIPARCQFYMGDENYRSFIDKKDEALCEYAQKKLEFLKRNINEFDHVIFVFQWKLWVAEHLGKSISALNLDTSKKLIFIGSKRFVVDKRAIINTEINSIAKLRSPRVEPVKNINKVLSLQTGHHHFINQDEMFCGKNNQCPLFTNQLQPISVDGQHLTKEGAMYLGKLLFAHPLLANLNAITRENLKN